MNLAISQEWCDPAETASVDGGEYLGQTIGAGELLAEIGFEVECEELMEDLVTALSDHDWYDSNWLILKPSHRWWLSWGRFREIVVHERRYSFWFSGSSSKSLADEELLSPRKLLERVESAIFDSGLIKRIGKGHEVWRLRRHSSDKRVFEAKDFTSPPVENSTQPNRMSPAGIPMFYGSDTFDTAKLELFDPTAKSNPNRGWNGLFRSALKTLIGLFRKRELVTGAKFRSIVDLDLLDLIAIPSPPSYFSPSGPFRCHLITFLQQFANDLSKPIAWDKRQHLEYVPTQVFTEYVRFVMKGREGVGVDGIRYRSSRNGKPCCVIFATQEECLPSDKGGLPTRQILEFIPESLETEPIQ